MFKLLIINPGSTSTKIGVYEDEHQVFVEDIPHSVAELQQYDEVTDQFSMRKQLVIDELDAKMHPLISQYIIELFNNPETNPKNAQLIFTTHDTHLLSQKILRRDQIWFTEKDSKERTDLYSLIDIVLPDGTKPRNDANYEKNYIAGRYGAIPYILND